jgi:hypothetical protein
MAGASVAKVMVLDWIVIGAGLLAYISSFLPWYTSTASIPILGITRLLRHDDAWHAGPSAWASVLTLLAAAGWVLVTSMGGPAQRTAPRALVALALCALAFITIVLRWATFPDARGGLGRVAQLGDINLGEVHLGGAFSVTSNADFGLVVALIAAVVATAAALLRFRVAARS